MRTRRLLAAVAAAAVTAGMALAVPADANHAWGNYHWARTSNPFTLKAGDNVTSAWDSYLNGAVADWNQSQVLDVTKVAGLMSNPKTCKGTPGRMEVCNAAYGFNQWLGIAQIRASGSHITQGVVKVNDSYFNTSTYNTPAWRQSVMCQEIGHVLGLHHNDEDFATTTGTCMDYSNNPSQNQHPDAHDYAMLESIYRHLDGSTTLGASTPGAGAGSAGFGNSVAEWGRAIRYDGAGRPSLFVRELANDERVFTFVTWA